MQQKLFDEFKAAGEQIVEADKADRKIRKTARHADYQKKRVAEATELWDNYNKKLTELKKALKQEDPCLVEWSDRYSTTYKEYTERLFAITDAEDEPIEEADRYEIQRSRFEQLKRVLGGVELKRDHNETPSTAFIAIKSKRVSEMWERIETDNDQLMIAKCEEPKWYSTEYDRCEELMENSLMFLQESIPVRQTNGDGIKLNRVDIQKFGGDYFKWITFRDLFSSLVIDNRNMKKSQKMQLLKSYVTGEAETLIRDLTISETNFDSAWNRLTDRYDNKRVVLYKLINRLMGQSTCKDDSKSIKTLLDTTDQILLALKNMNRTVEYWDDLVVVLVSQKLSDSSQKDWEHEIGDSNEIATWPQLKRFLEKQFRMLERVEGSKKRTDTRNDTKNEQKAIKSYQSSIETTACATCSSTDHTLYKCPAWVKMTPQERWGVARKQKWCFLCLRIHQGKRKCDKPRPCKKCDKKHSTWLHVNDEESQELVVTHRTMSSDSYETLLATAVVKVRDINGRAILLRALIDSGSEGSMLTEAAARRLQLREKRSDKWVAGLNGSKSGLLKKMTLTINPRFESTFAISADFYILQNLTKTLPNHDLNTNSWNHIKTLVWADPTFHKKGRIDALLGMDVIVEILKCGFIKGPRGQPMAQETELGWIMSGKLDPQYPSGEMKCLVSTHDTDGDDLQRFWELEELNPVRALTMDEITCERHYENTHRQAEDGKFVVKIPFKTGEVSPDRLGESRGQALARFLQLEKKFDRDNQLKMDYVRVIQEYIDLKQVREVTDSPPEDKKYYIPHHAVIKPDSLTTKTRVVFDASARTSSGLSLNDCMHTGAKQQKDLMNILLKWRLFKIVIKADIEKMYRMIELDQNDQKYHTFFWRTNSTDKMREYQMKAVTFGTAAAPFLATRTLKQIAYNVQNTHPLVAACLNEDFYVDDVVGGSHSVEEAIQCKDELITVLDGCNFKLRKWSSNNEDVLASLPAEMTEKSLQVFSDKESTKALGIIWVPQSDTFKFSCNWVVNQTTTWTKRQFLAEASKIFHPLGWLAPATVNAKMMMQEIWQEKLGWDDQIPQTLNARWVQFRSKLHKLEEISIIRWSSYTPGCEISIHGFSDASEKAYSAAVYAVIKLDGKVTTRLLTSKTRVAPLKSKLTLPRLELCGAVLTAALIDTVLKSFELTGIKSYLWTDSMITLGWINGEPQRWKTFVANRVAEIQSYQITEIRYIPSEQNPADCASRGLMPDELTTFDLWWNGPLWLIQNEDKWPQPETSEHELEMRNSIAVNMAQISSNDTMEATNSWYKMKRLAAYGLRFKTRATGNLTAAELNHAEKQLIKRTQEESFPEEMAALANRENIYKKSPLRALNVYLDEAGLMRVGGRLKNADMPQNAKHPMVLPAGRHITRAIVHQIHLDSLHGGPKLMRSLLLKKYWIVQAKKMTSDEYKKCVNCRRFGATSYNQQMGDLPRARVTLTRAFNETGVDYAGPIEVKTSRLRTARSEKGYVAVFVCMSTKAVHLELVSDQTTDAFLAALKRFVARRGLPARMYSDNGGTFVGAANQLEDNLIKQRNSELASNMANQGMDWKFIPAGSPNFGGLWERAVRSMKDHLKRTLKTANLTFEEYSTVLSQAEACLNSRPLCALSDNEEDINALTPGHFLVGTPLLAPPEPILDRTRINYTKRWAYVQQLQRQLWDRWHTEYLAELQKRNKWQQNSPNIRIGELVVVKDEDLLPRNWLLGRIEATHPGDDGQVRVATIKIANNVTSGNKLTKKKELLAWVNTPTKTTTIKRPVRKLCPLVITEENKAVIDAMEQAAPKPPQKQSTVKVKTGLNVALMLLGLLLCAINVMTEPISNCLKLQPFQNDAGIYFENLGRASMTRSEWNLVVYFDLQNYYTEVDRIRDANTDLRSLCHDVSNENAGGQCKNIVELLQSRIDEVTHMNILLKMNKQASETVRSKRAAPLNVIGWIGHELFGIMDAKRAKILERKIFDVKTKQGYFTELVRNQTSIVELTVNLIKSSNEELRNGMGSLSNALKTLKNETDIIRRKDQIIGWAMYTSLLIGRIERIQRNIINMLTDLQQGHISSYLFTPHQFKQQLNTINDQIPAGSKLPLDPQTDMRSFYEIMRGRMRVTERHILLEITLPLVSIAEFQVFHLIPVPFQHNNEHMSIIPDSKYLLITLQRDIFYQMDDHDLDECIRAQGAPIICQSKRPINNMQSSASKCERELLAKHTEFSSHCKINVTKPQDSWIQLKEKNLWIYGLRNKTTLNIVYSSEVDTITLQGSGKMEVSPGCEVIQHGFTMIGQAKVTTKGSMDFQPSVNLSQFIHEHPTELNLVNGTVDHSQQLTELYSLLEGTKHSAETTQLTHRWHLGINFTLIFSIMSIFLWYNRTKVLKLTWLICNQRRGDVENQHIIQLATLPIAAERSVPTAVENGSDDNNEKSSSTASWHGPGGCPFRT